MQTHLVYMLSPEAPAIRTGITTIPDTHVRKYKLSEVGCVVYCADCASAAGRAAPEGGHG